MYWYIINIIFVFLLGLLFGFTELVARYHELKYLFKVWSSYIYVILNGIISVCALLIIKYYKGQELTATVGLEIDNLVIAGLGGMMIFRSSLFSIKHKGNKIDIGFGSIAQTFLDLIEKRMKNNAAALRVKDMSVIMKNIIFEKAKDELSTLCINSIENFSKEDSESLVKEIIRISSLSLSNNNKSIQLGMSIAQYCDNKLLKNSIDVLKLRMTDEEIAELQNITIPHDIDFYISKLKNS